MVQILKKISLFSVVVAVSGLGIVAGQTLTRQVVSLTAAAATDTTVESQSGRYENLELFQKVLHFIESNYVTEVDNKELLQGAIKGMLETLDPHSNFLSAEVFKDMKIDTSGKFGGLGIELGLKDKVLTVIAPIEDTPAWKAGLKPNDKILKIENESTKGMTLVEAVSKMRGKKGSPIQIQIFREGFEKPKDIEIVRDIIKIRSVKDELIEPGMGYIRLTNFNENAAADIKKAIAKLEKSGGKLKGIILDLRTNPGGLLDQAVEVSSLFIDEGVVVSTIGRNKDQKEIKHARKGNARKDFPIAVLVNSSSASAAEIVAGALQDHRRAIIMGQPTFGKGSVQTVIDLGQEMGLKLTIAQYYTPSGRSIQEKGVIPDILLEDYDPKLLVSARRSGGGLREKDLKGHIVNPTLTEEEQKKASEKEEKETLAKEENADEMQPLRFDAKKDYQVREAVNYLKSYELFKKLAVSGNPLKEEPQEKTAQSPSPTKE